MSATSEEDSNVVNGRQHGEDLQVRDRRGRVAIDVFHLEDCRKLTRGLGSTMSEIPMSVPR